MLNSTRCRRRRRNRRRQTITTKRRPDENKTTSRSLARPTGTRQQNTEKKLNSRSPILSHSLRPVVVDEEDNNERANLLLLRPYVHSLELAPPLLPLARSLACNADACARSFVRSLIGALSSASLFVFAAMDFAPQSRRSIFHCNLVADSLARFSAMLRRNEKANRLNSPSLSG